MPGVRHEVPPQSSFPDLRILPLDALLPHEEHDVQRAEPLLEQIGQAETWLNPPIVAPIEHSDHYVVLDGANRHYTLRHLGFKYILAQVVAYDSADVRLETWHHAVRRLPSDALLEIIGHLDCVTMAHTDLLSARAALAAREIVMYVVVARDHVYALHPAPGQTCSRTASLRSVVNAYQPHGLISRITSDEIESVRALYPDVGGIVVFPHYEPAEIMVAARDGDLLPPGISRHIVHGRALRLHYPISELKDDGVSLEEKNAHLKQWIQERLAAKRIRFYAEPTFLFDE